jgi:uncharacterized membrane protein YgcG
MNYHFPHIMKLLNGKAISMKHALPLLTLWAIIAVGYQTATQAQEPNLPDKTETGKKTAIGAAAPAVPPGMSAPVGQRAAPAPGPGADPWAKLGRNPAGRTLLIHSTQKDPSVMTEIEEDLNVMARILEKTVEQYVKSAPVRKLGVVLQSLGQERPQAIYLDGYGALFVLHVRVPLVPTGPSEKAEAGAAPRQLPWDQARQELYGSEGARGEFMAGAEPPAEYDERLVASLKQQLLAALENATHLRHLKPDEYVTVTLLGTSGPQSPSRPRQAVAAPLTPPGVQPVPGAGESRGGTVGGEAVGGAAFGGSFYSGGSFSSAGGAGSFHGTAFGGGGVGTLEPGSRIGTTLTLRIKKSDADGLAAGKLSAEEFQKKAVIQTYEGNAPAGGAADFFNWGGGF